MKFLFASDSFKGTLSSETIHRFLSEAASEIFPGCKCQGVLMADGGEGTLEAVLSATGGRFQKKEVTGPLFEKIEASYGMLPGGEAVIEMARASGLPLVPLERRNPLFTTSYGTGELILDALERGCRKISVAIGGSATNDGGMGAMIALGIQFLDRNGRKLSGRGQDMGQVYKIDVSGIHPKVKETDFTVMCDVQNPLLGPNGATYTFGRQKGADERTLMELERGMEHLSGLIKETIGQDILGLPGAGAAGGLGGALMAFLSAKKKSGIDTVLDLIGFDELLKDVSLVVTGEGTMDWQSAFGKVPCGVGLRCKQAGIPAVAVVGGMGEGAEELYQYGIDSAISTVNRPMPLEVALADAEALYKDAARRLFRFIRTGFLLTD
ncbi:MAG: glycerate kinase [Lachnospiraceae bacterium]|nr:glycerate kinase [Lachnospiraceae bacterium]